MTNKSDNTKPADRAPSPDAFPVVGIGASAGGLTALTELFNHLPSDTGMAYVVVTHQHPGHKSLLPELLSRETRVTVVEAEEGTRLQPDHVYVGTPDGMLTIADGVLHRDKVADELSQRLPIDSFFRSLAYDMKERAICIVLSGTGSDGTEGVKAVKEEGGMAMAQEPQSADYAGMPASAIATGYIDFVLQPAAIPEQLVAYIQSPFLTASEVSRAGPLVSHEPMQKIFVLLRNRTGHDFSEYKSNTLRRRIERRMSIHQLDTYEKYVRYLQSDPGEVDALFRELLISVTRFFRDPEAWDEFSSSLEELLITRDVNHVVRAWVPGCATGEEVYSLAIVMRECMDRLERCFDVQIFGTDLDSNAIRIARVGRYPVGITMDVSHDRLERFFYEDQDGYRINKEIREMVIFAEQNVIKDPPFTRLDVITCRNLLIYLKSDLQKLLLPVFHYALLEEGLLFLGLSETVGMLDDRFETRNKRWKIFRRREIETAKPVLEKMPFMMTRGRPEQAVPVAKLPAEGDALTGLIEQRLLKQFVPACVVVNSQGDIFYINGRTGEYLEPTQGEPRNNILDMAREGMQIELASALYECRMQQAVIHREDITVKTNDRSIRVGLTVSKLQEPRPLAGLLLVVFRKGGALQKATPSATDIKIANGAGEKTNLERKLRYVQQSHQNALEQVKASNLDLKSANEELQSTNEELQSTNEELETSREEMQSLNEELSTVNAELQSNLEELSHANDDMKNLLNSTNIATLFLDTDCNIKRFTDQMQKIIKLRDSDAGRPVSDLSSNLVDEDLDSSCREVLRTLVFKESEVMSRDGNSYLMRIMPYRTTTNVIEGVVISFVDINRVKASEASRDYFKDIVDAIREPLLILDDHLRILTANRAFCRYFHTTSANTEGERIYDIAEGRWDLEQLRRLLEDILPGNTMLEDFEVKAKLPRLGERIFALNARRLVQTDGSLERIILAFEDVTDKPAFSVETSG